MLRIPEPLREHLKQCVTTICYVMKITTVSGQVFGMTTHPVTIVFDGVTYNPMNGFDQSNIVSNTAFSVSNGQPTAFFSAKVDGLTYEDAMAGVLDNASWSLGLLNWLNPSLDMYAVIDSGDVGEVKIVDQMIYMPELISYMLRLKQFIGDVWSRRCRATFGEPANSQHGCGVDASDMWEENTVSQVSADEPTRVFAAAGMDDSIGIPGRIIWLTGDNTASRMYQIEARSIVSDTVSLMEPTPFLIKVGDTFKARRDCNKSPSNCISYGNFINYKGEPFTPTGDGLETMTPSAQTFGGISGSEIID